jgi:hypothetical protein
MSTKELLQRVLIYEEALLKNYHKYIDLTEATEIGLLFEELAAEKTLQINKLKTVLKSYCTS